MGYNRKKPVVRANDLLKDSRVPDHVKKQIRGERQNQDGAVTARRGYGSPQGPAEVRGETPPLKEKVRSYFRPMTDEEAREDERVRQVKPRVVRQGSDANEGPQPTMANSRFGRDVEKFRKGVGNLMDSHRKWVEEGNKKNAGQQTGQRKSKGGNGPRPGIHQVPRSMGYPDQLESPDFGFNIDEEGLSRALGSAGGQIGDGLEDIFAWGGGGGGGGSRPRKKRNR